MTLARTYLFFMATTWRNRVRRFLNRLRSPRYAIAFIIGALYFFFALGGPALFRPGRDASGVTQGLISAYRYVGPIVVFLLMAIWWIWGGSRAAIALSPAEANLLVPAPLTRRQLIQLKLIMAQPGILVTVAIMSGVLRGSALPWWILLPSAWVVIATLHLHQIAASLVHAGLMHGRSAWKRLWPVTLAFAVALFAVVGAVARGFSGVRAAESMEEMLAALRLIFDTPPASVALAPITAVLAPVFAEDLAMWARSFGIAFTLLVLHYIWVMRTDAAFEESAVEAGARRAELLEAMRKGKRVDLSAGKPRKLRQPWFALNPIGPPAYAIWWKNVLQFTRAVSPLMLVLIPFVAGLIGVADYSESRSIAKAAAAGGMVLMVLGGAATLFGPLAVRNDLRTDLRRIELLRTLPVSGRPLVTAQIAAAAFSITSVQFLLLGIGGALILLSGTIPEPWMSIFVAIPIAVILPACNTGLLVIHNGFALFFPAWTRMGADAPGGIENIGMQILTLVGGSLIFLISIIPPLLVAGATAGSTMAQWGKYAIIPAGIAFIVAFYLEVFGALTWMGSAYDRIDPVETGLCS